MILTKNPSFRTDTKQKKAIGDPYETGGFAMKQQELDYILTSMLKAYDNVSDLNFTVDKPCQVEASGQLKPVLTEPLPKKLTAFQTEAIALNLVKGDRRLIKNLLAEGSCDISYQLAGKARFRVNIFSQREIGRAHV